MAKLHIDFDRALGRVRPMHGVGQPPLTGIDNCMFHYLKEAGVPYSRPHDAGGDFGGGVYCDISCVFPDFSRDPADPDAYCFEFTDNLLAGLVENGVEPFYRLGEAIENHQRLRRYTTNPPADYDKWARVCEGVIRHVNEGWANGHHFGIRYFEIWNEPDNDIPNRDNQMWSGSMEDYFRLYDVASKYLKARFPKLQIGGYAACGFYAEANRLAGRSFSDREQYFDDFFHAFLKFAGENQMPAGLLLVAQLRVPRGHGEHGALLPPSPRRGRVRERADDYERMEPLDSLPRIRLRRRRSRGDVPAHAPRRRGSLHVL